MSYTRGMPRARLALIGLYAVGDAAALGAAMTTLGATGARLSVGAAVVVTALALCGVAGARLAVTLANVDRTARIGVLVAVFAVLAFLLVAYSGRSASAIALGAGAALILWLRGMSLGGDEFTPDGARKRLWIGLVITAGMSALTGAPALIFLFTFATLAAAQISLLTSVAARRDVDPRALARPRWIRMLLAIELVVMGLMILEVAVFNLDAVSRALQLVMLILMLPMALLVALVGGVVLLFISPEMIADLMQRLSEFLATQFRFTGAADSNLMVPPTAPNPIPPVVGVALAVGIAVALLALVAFIAGMARAAQRRARALARPDMPEAAPAGAASAVAAPAVSPVRALLSRLFAAATIRLIYARMTAEAARRGSPRRAAQTPLEYQPTLARVFPGAEADTDRLTRAYIAAHYGEVPDTVDALRDIRAAWARARRTAPPVAS